MKTNNFFNNTTKFVRSTVLVIITLLFCLTISTTYADGTVVNVNNDGINNTYNRNIPASGLIVVSPRNDDNRSLDKYLPN